MLLNFSVSCMFVPFSVLFFFFNHVCQIGWIIAGCFTIVSTITSFWLINKHLQWYNHVCILCMLRVHLFKYKQKREQRCEYGQFLKLKERCVTWSHLLDIVRILFMVPLYALISFASFLFWVSRRLRKYDHLLTLRIQNHSTPLLLVRDAYESIVLTAFFYLLLIYLSPDVEEQKLIFLKLGLSREADNEARRNRQEIKKWILPLGFVKWKPSVCLHFFITLSSNVTHRSGWSVFSPIDEVGCSSILRNPTHVCQLFVSHTLVHRTCTEQL